MRIRPPGPRVAGVCVVTTDGFMCRRLAVSDPRVALPNFYDVAIGIANVAARLTVFGLGLRDELGSSTSPQFIARLNICDADIHEAAD
jgi:hypothetical protein